LTVFIISQATKNNGHAGASSGIAHGMITAAFISAMIGNELPGHGSVYLGQTLNPNAGGYMP
jgi:acyl dehydratase